MAQLQMRWYADFSSLPPSVIPDGFRLRALTSADLAPYSELRVSAEFGAWDEPTMATYLEKSALPSGLLLLEHIASGRFAASAGAEHNPTPGFGTLGWVMCHPDFRGSHLGYAICLAAMYKLYAANYRTFTLLTDDFRLPAIKTYLRLGWRPHIVDDTMPDRWKAIANQLKMDMTTPLNPMN